jgi:hypothetical protein
MSKAFPLAILSRIICMYCCGPVRGNKFTIQNEILAVSRKDNGCQSSVDAARNNKAEEAASGAVGFG